jgi:hypothetical protein
LVLSRHQLSNPYFNLFNLHCIFEFVAATAQALPYAISATVRICHRFLIAPQANCPLIYVTIRAFNWALLWAALF